MKRPKLLTNRQAQLFSSVSYETGALIGPKAACLSQDGDTGEFQLCIYLGTRLEKTAVKKSQKLLNKIGGEP